MSYEIAKKFWSERICYPDYPNTKQRRLIDVNFVIENIEDPSTVLDLGCADGYLLIALREFTDIIKFYGYDISKELLSELKLRWGNIKELETKACDFTQRIEYPATDLTTSMGMFPYIFEYEDLYNILKNIKSDMLIVRAPCTEKDKDEYIKVYSKELCSDYSALYRTVQSYFAILNIFYKYVYIERAYPDEIESKYGTKHFFFVCRR